MMIVKKDEGRMMMIDDGSSGSSKLLHYVQVMDIFMLFAGNHKTFPATF